MTSTEEISLDFGDSPHGIEDLEIVARGGGFTVAASYHITDRDRNAVIATAFAAQLGLHSVDYTRRTYVEPNVHHRPPRDARLADAIGITEDAKRLVKAAALRGYAIRNKADHVGLFASGSALLRLPVTFRGAALTIRNGFHFESAVLSRLILEQLAWSYAVRPISDREIFKTEPHKCVTQLKRLLPGAGLLYGELSRSSHVMPPTTLRYITFEDGEPSVTFISFEQTRNDALLLLRLADYYCVVSEFVFREYYEKFYHIGMDNEGLVMPTPDRPGLSLLDQWRTVVVAAEGSAV